MCFNRAKIIAIVAIVLTQGCMSERKSAVPMVDDIGADVSTRYRYRLSCVYKGEKSETVKLRGDLLASCYPSVFFIPATSISISSSLKDSRQALTCVSPPSIKIKSGGMRFSSFILLYRLYVTSFIVP